MNATAKSTFTKCWDACREPATHVMTREGSIPLHACDRHTRIDRAEAESRGWTVAPLAATVREQAEAKVRAMAAKLSTEVLCLAWMATEGKPGTQELALTRGWIMDELNRRLGDDLFDEWLISDENPLAYFAKGK
jgi:hypothetical protein